MKANPMLAGQPSLVGLALSLPMLALAGLMLAGCTGGVKGDPDNRGDFKVVSISTGSGAVYPYRVRRVVGGVPTSTIINIGDESDLRNNVSGTNGVLPVATLPETTVLPDGSPGNHFLHFAFSHKLNIESILSNQLSDQANAGLRGSLLLLAYDPATETSVTIPGRGFVNGFTYYNEGGVLRRVRAVEADGIGVRAIDPRGVGFPNYPGAADLVTNKSFTFVADSDNNLATLERFPANRLLRLLVTNAVRDTENDLLEQEVGVATTVGPDNGPPQVLGYSTVAPEIQPGNGETGVDPTASILVRFNKPVQPAAVGSFFTQGVFTPPSGGLQLSVTFAAATFPVLYFADPVSYGDLMNYVIRPAYTLPGNSVVDINVQVTTIRSLNQTLIGQPVATSFRTGVGPGLVNAPVAPEAIYIGIGGAEPGVSVIDMHGFGQGTGDPAITRFLRNPNLNAAGVSPPLVPGSSSLDAGGAGVFTLTQDTNGSTRLLRDPVVSDVNDIHIGAPLDLLFNNENINGNVTRANQVNELLGIAMVGNVITQGPIPNPPKLAFPPPNPNRLIFGEEPTVKSSFAVAGSLATGGPPVGCVASPLNRLGRGDPRALQGTAIGVFGTALMNVFVGPQPPPPSPPPATAYCPYTSRQQVGHFLYVLDRDNRQIVVLNSNRFTVLDTIRLSDPVSMAMSPNLNRLAVTNFSSSSVSFIDIDPLSSRFHEIVTETRVDNGPTGIAWQPDGEDILVLSTDANLLTIISGIDFRIRRTVGGFLNEPIDVVCSERFLGNGNTSGVYYAYILNGDGSVAIYESGPDGVNGIGFNDIIGTIADASFPRARAMCIDMAAPLSGVFVGHQDDQGLGQVSRLTLDSTPFNQQPLNPIATGFILPPTYRQKQWRVTQRIGGLTATTPVVDLLSGGSVVDLCPDDLVNFGGYDGQGNLFAPTYAQTPFRHSGKHVLKATPNGALVRASTPRFLFIALSDAGAVDVFEIASGAKIASISVPGVRVVSNYWRQ